MAFSVQKLTTLYILSTLALFGYTFYEVFKTADNYFSAGLIYMDDTVTNFIFYNLVFALGIVFYKSCVWLFFVEVKENETIKMVDKLKAKIIDVILFCYIMEGEIQINSFTCIVFIFFSYILHCMAVFRAQYLIHTPSTLSLNLNYRLTALLLILIFFDYEMLYYSIDLLYSQSPTHFIFVYYTIIISLSLIQPVVQYFLDFYEKYTFNHIKNIDERLALISLLISVPRLLIQILLAIWLAMRFSIFFYLIFTLIELVSQLTQTIKSYNRVKKLTDTMKNLKKINQQEIEKHHDNTCMVCFQDMTEATLLPCKHFFHDECLRQWIIKNSNHFCPKCKKEFNFDNKNNQQKNQLQENRNGMENERQVNQRLRQERLRRLEKIQQKMIAKEKKKLSKKDQTLQQNSQSHGNLDQNLLQEKPHYKKLIKQESPRKIQQKIQASQHNQSNVHNPNTNSIQQLSYRGQLEPIQLISPDTPLQIVNKKRHRYLPIGSLAYGLPTEAVYRRTYRHMYMRDTYERANEELIKDFSLNQYQQLMLFAQR